MVRQCRFGRYSCLIVSRHHSSGTSLLADVLWGCFYSLQTSGARNWPNQPSARSLGNVRSLITTESASFSRLLSTLGPKTVSRPPREGPRSA